MTQLRDVPTEKLIAELDRRGEDYCSGHGERCTWCKRRSRSFPFMMVNGVCDNCLHAHALRSATVAAFKEHRKACDGCEDCNAMAESPMIRKSEAAS